MLGMARAKYRGGFMNMLNKVEIEGITKAGAESKLYPNNKIGYSFHIESRRFEGKQEKIEKEDSVFSILFYKRAEFPEEYLRAGQQIRVVGRLKSDSEGRVTIIAESIEPVT